MMHRRLIIYTALTLLPMASIGVSADTETVKQNYISCVTPLDYVSDAYFYGADASVPWNTSARLMTTVDY